MRKMSKNAWVFQMTVHGVEPDNDVIIQELINESGGLMIGKRKFSKGVSYLLVVDLLALDILMTGMAEAYTNQMPMALTIQEAEIFVAKIKELREGS